MPDPDALLPAGRLDRTPRTRRSPASGPRRSTGRPPASRWTPRTRRTATRRRCPFRATWRTIWPPTWRRWPRGRPSSRCPPREPRCSGPTWKPPASPTWMHPVCSSTSTPCDARPRRWPMPLGFRPASFRRLMRHSSLELTGRYTKPRAVDIEAAASMLPSLKPTGDRPERLAMTGTDGPVGHRHWSESAGPDQTYPENSASEGSSISEHFGHHLATAPAGNSRELPETGVMMGSALRHLMGPKSLEDMGLDANWRDETDTVGSTPDRIRTYNLRFRRPMLYPIELRVRLACGDRAGLILTSGCARRQAPADCGHRGPSRSRSSQTETVRPSSAER